MPGVDTLRVSVTDRCNLRCLYCMPREGIVLCDRDAVLSFAEIVRIVRLAVRLGVHKVRLTGGEPLVRRGLPELIAELAAIDGVCDLPITSNGVLLAGLAERLRDAGATRVTVSLDTLDRDRFQQITGSDHLPQVLEGIEAARRAGLQPLKINTVVIRDVNHDEPPAFAALARTADLEVRFIEEMAFGPARLRGTAQPRPVVTSLEVQAQIEAHYGPLLPLPSPAGATARVFAMAGGRGRIGFISPVSEPFCTDCSRLRLSPEGALRLCLAGSDTLDLRGPLRSGADDDQLLAMLEGAVRSKPRGRAGDFASIDRPCMAQIGG